MSNQEDANPLAAVFRLHEEIGALLDDPDSAGEPDAFLGELVLLATELSTAAQSADKDDFDSEYSEDEDDEPDAIDAEIVL